MKILQVSDIRGSLEQSLLTGPSYLLRMILALLGDVASLHNSMSWMVWSFAQLSLGRVITHPCAGEADSFTAALHHNTKVRFMTMQDRPPANFLLTEKLNLPLHISIMIDLIIL